MTLSYGKMSQLFVHAEYADVISYMENRISHCGPIPWPLNSLDLIPPGLFVWRLMKGMATGSEYTQVELLH